MVISKKELNRALKGCSLYHLCERDKLQSSTYKSVKLLTGSLPINDGVSRLLAEQTAKEYDVRLGLSDFGGSDEEENLVNVFFYTCRKPEELEQAKRQLSKAESKLEEKLNALDKKLVELAYSK